jgi:glycosyltransferase involved in cell wall biosynthesis
MEAMACQIPCVVTNVGDQGQLVGESGIVVSPGSDKALSEGCLKILSMSSTQREGLGSSARAKILKSYSLERTTSEYLRVYHEAIL